MHIKFWLGSLKGKDNSEDIGIDGRIILKWILNRVGGCGLNSTGSKIGTGGGLLWTQ
jgi:hypothetical protein